MLKPKRTSHKICDRCGKKYYRSNRVRLWTTCNPGHRNGWQKDDLRLCTGCMNQSAARSAARLVSARIVEINMGSYTGRRKLA